MMRWMHACLWMVLLGIMQGCYSINQFQSEFASIHDYGYFNARQYVIMFDAVSVKDTTVAQYSFSNPPLRDFIVVMIFENKEDLDLLATHAALAQVTISDYVAGIVYDFTGRLSSELSETKPADGSSGNQWNFAGFGEVNPPPNWQFNESRVSTNPTTSPFPLGEGQYRLEFRIQTERRLPRVISVHLALQGLGAGSI